MLANHSAALFCSGKYFSSFCILMDFVFIPNQAFCTIFSDSFMHKDEDFEVFNQTALDFKQIRQVIWLT